MSRIALCFIVPFLLIIFQASADESAKHSDAPQVTLSREYLARSRFFDRLNAHYSGNESADMIEGRIRRAREDTEKQFAWILREYPLYTVLPTSALYVAVSGLSAKWAAKNLIWLAQQAMVNREKVVFWSILSLPVLVIGGGLFFGSLPNLYHGFYYSLFPPMLPEVSLVTAYGSKKALLPKSTQSYIEDELFYNFWQRPSSDGFKRLQKILDKALRLPLYRKSLTYNYDAIEDSLKYFSPTLVERLDRFVYSEIAYQKMDAQVSESHYPVYFQGAPGTGKTYAAQKLAEAMDTNLAVVTLDGSSVDDIVGTSFEREDSKPGLLVDAIVASTKSSRDINHKNQILLIDEFDRLFISGDERNKEILSFLLKLLDPKNRHFYSPYLKTIVHLPDTIILAGNSDINSLSYNSPELEAIASRLDTVVFSGFPTETKSSIAFETLIPNKIKRYQSIGNEFADFYLPDKGYEMIESFIENDSDTGLRSLEKYLTEVFEVFSKQYGVSALKDDA